MKTSNTFVSLWFIPESYFVRYKKGYEMIDLLIAPGAPYFALAVLGACISATGILQIEQAHRVLSGVWAIPGRWNLIGRLMAGQVAGLALAATLLIATLAADMRGGPRILMLALALALYMYIGIVVPRRPLVQAQRERALLRRLTPGFTGYVRIGLAGYDAPAMLLERYTVQPAARLQPMRRIAAEALELMNERRMRPFAAFRTIAHARGCQELLDVAETLAQAEAEGVDIQAVLAAHEQTLEAILRDEFLRMLKRRTLYLLGIVAISLVVGILGNLLFVMVGGTIPLGNGTTYAAG